MVTGAWGLTLMPILGVLAQSPASRGWRQATKAQLIAAPGSKTKTSFQGGGVDPSKRGEVG